jgi:hypothetical protein
MTILFASTNNAARESSRVEANAEIFYFCAFIREYLDRTIDLLQTKQFFPSRSPFISNYSIARASAVLVFSCL